MADALTPEESADLSSQVVGALLDNQTRVRKLFRRWLIAAGLVIGLGVGYVAFTVHEVRTSQVANTKKTDHHDQCVQTADHDLGFDLMLVTRPGETPQQFHADIKIPSATC